ncbi:hypothetical protein GIB67_000803 [Kingdonia uniflora]|uniref:F-box protein n=1 Tax=Kingdonia uniflora TaxID=39325 RepID=A0A7J7NZY2_9MAGN|nr:hypothetical protein GIB67_000803 [Kingdonia uniflora]
MATFRTNEEALTSSSSSFNFADFPEDVQLCILSFLTPSEISAFSCTSKRFLSLCRSDTKLWFSMCDRRWGLKTQIKKWGDGQIKFKFLYNTLNRWENLIGFWRRSGLGISTPPLVFFEWGSSFITGSRVSPSKIGNYGVIKSSFLWMGLSPNGEPLNFLDTDCKFELKGDFEKAVELGLSDTDLVAVRVSFIGNNHVVVEENFGHVEDVIGEESMSPGSIPDHLMLNIYQYFANRTSPGGDRASRRQRRRERERHGRRKWEPEHFVKIVYCCPTLSRPLQGLWKGICDDMSLDFYLVVYDDIGGIACRRVGDASEPFSGYSPVFWTSNTTFIDFPFSLEEKRLYESRIHLRPPVAENHSYGHSPPIEDEVVLRILNINSSYNLVIPDLTGSSINTRHLEGRIWHYANGTFGFGFLRNNFIVDLKHIAVHEYLLDSV